MANKSNSWDTTEIHRRYLAERDKRLRADTDAQYLEASGEFARFKADPRARQVSERAPVDEQVEVAIVGAGFGGMITGMKLRQAGIDSFRIIDLAADFGGTWYWNRYPGVRCDIESYCYMPMLEEVGTVPSERYATGKEIFEHSQRFAQHFDLYRHALLRTKVQEIQWHEDELRWHISTDRGDRIRARFVTVAQGPLAKVKLPGIEGIRDFKGRIFHSARWDYDYTGGDSEGGQTGLRDQRVAVIGTGATAVQIVPKLAEHAQKLYVFQRTPSAVAPRNNRRTDRDWYDAQARGWQEARMDNFLGTISFHPPQEDLVADCWTDFFTRFANGIKSRMAARERFDPHHLMQEVDYAKMQEIREHVGKVVENPATAESLKPWYNYLCKRPLFSDDFLQSFNRPNVTLVDTAGRGVERIDSSGIIANDRHYEVDAIIFATGFDVGAAPHKVGEYTVTGRNGVTLDQKWAAGIRTLHGTQVSGFPNFHIVGAAAQGIAAFNFTHVLLIQATHAVEQIAACSRKGIVAADVTEQSESKWHAAMQQHHVDRSHFYEECTPGFLNNEGRFKDKPTYIGGSFGGGPIEYRRLIAAWREQEFDSDTLRLGGDKPASG
jgi:cyclohexanone monooxygenase